MGTPPNLISFSVEVTFKLVQVGPALFLRGVPQALSTAWLNPGVKMKKLVISRLPLLPHPQYFILPEQPPAPTTTAPCLRLLGSHCCLRHLLWHPRQTLSPLGGPLLAWVLAQAVRSALPGALRPEALLSFILLHDRSQTCLSLLRSLTQHGGEDKVTEGHRVQGGSRQERRCN